MGSACEAGELYRGILEGETGRRDRPSGAASMIICEIQPLGNDEFMLRDERQVSADSG